MAFFFGMRVEDLQELPLESCCSVRGWLHCGKLEQRKQADIGNQEGMKLPVLPLVPCIPLSPQGFTEGSRTWAGAFEKVSALSGHGAQGHPVSYGFERLMST